VCFGVRDRRTGSWNTSHWALGRPLFGSIVDSRGDLCSLGVPGVSEPLCFLVDEQPHYTSAVISIEEREQMELPGHVSPLLRRELARKPTGTIRETY
jgi:hypothetical protein